MNTIFGGCFMCGESASLVCTGCREHRYCCTEHQRLSWETGHREVCGKPTAPNWETKTAAFLQAMEARDIVTAARIGPSAIHEMRDKQTLLATHLPAKVARLAQWVGQADVCRGVKIARYGTRLADAFATLDSINATHTQLVETITNDTLLTPESKYTAICLSQDAVEARTSGVTRSLTIEAERAFHADNYDMYKLDKETKRVLQATAPDLIPVFLMMNRDLVTKLAFLNVQQVTSDDDAADDAVPSSVVVTEIQARVSMRRGGGTAADELSDDENARAVTPRGARARRGPVPPAGGPPGGGGGAPIPAPAPAPVIGGGGGGAAPFTNAADNNEIQVMETALRDRNHTTMLDIMWKYSSFKASDDVWTAKMTMATGGVTTFAGNLPHIVASRFFPSLTTLTEPTPLLPSLVRFSLFNTAVRASFNKRMGNQGNMVRLNATYEQEFRRFVIFVRRQQAITNNLRVRLFTDPIAIERLREVADSRLLSIFATDPLFNLHETMNQIEDDTMMGLANMLTVGNNLVIANVGAVLFPRIWPSNWMMSGVDSGINAGRAILGLTMPNNDVAEFLAMRLRNFATRKEANHEKDWLAQIFLGELKANDDGYFYEPGGFTTGDSDGIQSRILDDMYKKKIGFSLYDVPDNATFSQFVTRVIERSQYVYRRGVGRPAPSQTGPTDYAYFGSSPTGAIFSAFSRSVLPMMVFAGGTFGLYQAGVGDLTTIMAGSTLMLANGYMFGAAIEMSWQTLGGALNFKDYDFVNLDTAMLWPPPEYPDDEGQPRRSVQVARAQATAPRSGGAIVAAFFRMMGTTPLAVIDAFFDRVPRSAYTHRAVWLRRMVSTDIVQDLRGVARIASNRNLERGVDNGMASGAANALGVKRRTLIKFYIAGVAGMYGGFKLIAYTVGWVDNNKVSIAMKGATLYMLGASIPPWLLPSLSVLFGVPTTMVGFAHLLSDYAFTRKRIDPDIDPLTTRLSLWERLTAFLFDMYDGTPGDLITFWLVIANLPSLFELGLTG